jgi:DNA polymerase-3 subunit alpha
MQFVHLRAHTEFSITDGILRIDDWVKAAAADGQGALAITDAMNLFGAIKFYQAARARGIQPILGADVWITPPDADERGAGRAAAAAAAAAADAPSPRMLLLARNQRGYLNLSELLSRGWLHNQRKGHAEIDWRWLEHDGLAEGLIALSGAQDGAVGQALAQGDAARARAAAAREARVFGAGCYFIELQRCGRGGEDDYVAAACALAAELGLPVVATHPVQFLEPDDFDAHDVRVCVAEGEIVANPRRVRRFTRAQHFTTRQAMAERFADIPSALSNSVQIARRCVVELKLGEPKLPLFPTPLVDGRPMPVNDFLRASALAGLDERLEQLYPNAEERAARRPAYLQRLDFELDTIIRMGFPGYFLIVADFINWAKNNGCPVGPGRGSGAGSLVAYALRITDLDPLRYSLLFERFLNPERKSMPDFDIDFCQENRDRVIDYVRAKYGKDAVAQIATFGTMAARAAIRDVGRVLEFPYNYCDGLSKLVPGKPGVVYSLQLPPGMREPPQEKEPDDKTQYALELEPMLAQRWRDEEEARALLAMAARLEGITRNVGMHAGGVLIAPGKLTDFTPLFVQPGEQAAVSQFDKDDVEAAGLVKFDFLGLATLTILERTKDAIRARYPERRDFRIEDIPLDDARVYREIFSEARTVAVFQFESHGMQRMLRDAKPDCFDDIIALVALFRPGPMDLIPSFCARKHGREPVSYPDPRVEPLLRETYGIMVYQEQVMQIAQVLGGYSLGNADLLRRAMGKKKPEEMVKHRATFAAGALQNGLTEAQANDIFDLMEKFAGYGFNKSHAAAYALLAVQTAWLKLHYPAEFMAANMSVMIDSSDKLEVLVRDSRELGLVVRPPDINASGWAFEPLGRRTVRYGLGAVKGTGRAAVEAIVAARARGGPFKSLFDFAARVDTQQVNRRVFEALGKAGAFDSLHADRAQVLGNVERALRHAQACAASVGQIGLFDAIADDGGGAVQAAPELEPVAPMTVAALLSQEKAALGFYFTAHLIDDYADEVARMGLPPIERLERSGSERVWVAAIVGSVRWIKSKRGEIAIAVLGDKTGEIDALFGESLDVARLRPLVAEDQFVVVRARVQPDRATGGLRLAVDEVLDLHGARLRLGKVALLRIGEKASAEALGRALHGCLKRLPQEAGGGDDAGTAAADAAAPAGLPLVADLCRGGARWQMRLDASWRIVPDEATLRSLAAALGVPPPAAGANASAAFLRVEYRWPPQPQLHEVPTHYEQAA